MPTYDVPGVYIEEVTGPGVIAGVSTSTAAFVGPALNGPMNQPTFITSFDDFLAQFCLAMPDGSYQTYINAPRRFFLAHAVRGFFENGGTQGYIVRVGTAKAAEWAILNGEPETAFRLQAKVASVAGNNITIQVASANATGPGGVSVASLSANVQTVNDAALTFAAPPPFVPGDIVTNGTGAENFAARATVLQVQGNNLTLSNPIPGLVNGNQVRIASIVESQNTFRMAGTKGLYSGSIVQIAGDDADHPNTPVSDYGLIQIVDQLGFVTFAPSPARAHKYNLAAPAPKVTSKEFRLTVTPPAGAAETFDNLSVVAGHPGYVFTAVKSGLVNVHAAASPPQAKIPNNLIPAVVGNVPRSVDGVNDDPGSLTSAGFEAGLTALVDIDDVEILCLPDAAAHPEAITLQQDMRDHCLKKKNRFAILDSLPGAPPTGAGSVLEQRASVEDSLGFAALYYPWLVAKDPASTGPLPQTILIPPSGHIAGVYARTDSERGVHKAPANTDLRGILGIEVRLSDRQQGPLNLAGIDVLRIFPGTAQVIVWGARTTVRKDITDWIYVSVRRLMIYIEQSIEQGIRWAVFEPNGLPLWQKLKRTITEFLTRVWRDGALFGATADKAFYVRIDEALNPPSTRALGRLYIEIGVAAVRPAEFIIVRIGLWDGGAEVLEQ